MQTTQVGWKLLCLCLVACLSCLGDDSHKGTSGLALSTAPDASPRPDGNTASFDDETSLCPPGTNRIVGTPGPDRIEGTNGADCILGLGGDDELIGQNGEDVLIGGEGNDLLIGGNGKDVLYGGDGDDHLLGGNGKDVLYGEAGDDHLDGELGKDELLGGDGCDVLDARDGPDSASGGEGNDVIHGDNQVKQAHGDNGDDTIGISHPGGSSITTRKSPEDGGDGEDSCDGENCELPPPTTCDEETETGCDPDFACVIGLCVPADRCHGGCTITDPIGDFTCDGLDDDCDGQIDEDFIVEPSNCGIGACTATGELRCVDGGVEDTCSPGSPAANDATCNGIDEDCDGRIDEDFAAVVTSCGVGVCAANGVTTCSAGMPGDTCEPLPPASSVDTCNALDDDCDGQVDEDFTSTITSCGIGECAAQGATSCTNGAVVDRCVPGVPAPADTVCNGLDEDCDGPIDEDYQSQPTQCGVGACASVGATTCEAGQIVDSCAPGLPASGDDTCDGIDDDCDGQIDEDYAPTSVSCGVGACVASGERTCTNGVEENSCSPGTPAVDDSTCDGIDNDCDGETDEDAVETPTSCGQGVCATTGTNACIAGQTVNTCRPTLAATIDDTCDGLDDDCDGQVDEDCCVPTTCADVGATCGRIESCGQVVLCGSCTSSEPVCGADYTCTPETTVRAGEDREAIWGEPLLFGRRWEFDAGSHGQFAGSSVWMDCTWDFGDGTAPVLVEKCSDNRRERPSHTYAAPGVYTVTVTATVMSSPSFPDTVGESAVDTLTVTVRPRPSAIVVTNATTTATPHTYNVHAQLADAHDGSVAMAFLPVTLSYNSQETPTLTDANGQTTASFDWLPNATVAVSASFPGNEFYLPTQGQASFFVGRQGPELIREPSIGSEGRHFVLAFPQNSSNTDLQADAHDDKVPEQGLYLHLSARTPTLATISAPGIGFLKEVPVTPGQSMAVQLPEELRTGAISTKTTYSESGLIQPLAVEVTAEEPIAVHALDQIYASTDGYLGLPVEELGTEYMVLAYPNEKIANGSISQGTQLVVAATEDDTVVTITPSVDISPGTQVPAGIQANVPTAITLHKGETLLLANQGGGAATDWQDLSGTSILASAKVAVFAGHACTTVTVPHCDHLVEQLPPVSALGRRFLTVPLGSRQSGDAFVLVATQDDTVVRHNGATMATLQRGQVHYFEGHEDEYSVVESTEPVVLAQYSKGKTYGGQLAVTEAGDPFMMLVPPEGQYPSSYVLRTPAVLPSLEKSQVHFLSLIVRADAARGVRLNGTEFAAQWNAIGHSGWVGARIQVSDGPIRIDHKRGDEPIGLMSYGFASFDSYGYPGGWRFSPRGCERTRATPGDGIDNDCDGRSDEETANGLDDDGDGFVDEDLTETDKPRGNLPPVADPGFFSIIRQSVLYPIAVRRFLLPGYDPNDDAIIFEILEGPTQGTATVAGRILEYLPVPTNPARIESLTVRAFDGQAYSEPAVIRIELRDRTFGGCADKETCSNKPPQITWPAPQTIRLEEGETQRQIAGKPSSFDVNRDDIRFELVSGPQGLEMNDQGEWSYTVSRDDATLTHPNGLAFGYVDVQVQVFENDVALPSLQSARLAVVWSDESDGFPIFVSTPTPSVFLNTNYEYTAVAVDPEKQAITYSLDTAPPWLQINAQTGQLSGQTNLEGDYPVQVRATDIAGETATQSFTITVYGAGPTILSTPLTIANQDRPYSHTPTVVHPNSGETLRWELVLAPDGMSIDAQTGTLSWTPTAFHVGISHTVRIEVIDSASLRDGQTFSVLVNDQSVAPTIDSEAPLRVHVDDLYLYQVEASDPDPNDVLGYELTIAPEGMTIGQGTGLIQWLPDTAGLFAVEVAVYDTALNRDVQQFVVEVEPDFVAPKIAITAEPATINIGETTTVSVALQGAFDPSTVTLRIDDIPVPLNANLEASYTPTSSGSHLAVATAADASGNLGTDTVAIAVREPLDTTAPVAELTSVSEDDVLTYLHDLIGTASDDNLLHYTLALRPTASTEFVTFATGYTSVTSGSLATLDTTLLENGTYELRLTATDVNGLTATDSRRVRIHGGAKVGVVQLSFVDMAIEMAGVPLTVVRTYDSRDKRLGDFGYGWNLDVRGGRVSHNRPIGEGFAIYSGTDPFELPCQRTFEQDSHFTEVRLSDSEWYLFQPVAVNVTALSGSCTADIVFEQVDGSRDGAELSVIGETEVRARPQAPTNNLNELVYGQLTEVFTGRNFDPQTLRLQTADGRTIDLHTQRGVTFVEDANGNSVAYEKDFIAHSDGRTIELTRDEQDRITTIADPMGHTVQYQYDDQGDLVGVVDLTGAYTEFVYEAPVDHHLTGIIDPNGNRIAALEYDSDGRLAVSCDANQDCSRIAYDLVGQSQSIEDPTRRQTSFTYDVQGNVLTSTDGSGNTTTMTYDLRNRLVSSTDPLGNTTSYTYNGNGDILSRTDPHGAGEDPANHTVRYTYSQDKRFRLTSVTLKSGATIHRDYDSGGNLVSISDDDGNSIFSATRSGQGHLLSKTDRFGTKQYQYTPGVAQPTRVMDGSGVETRYFYDDSNRLIRMLRNGTVAEFTYDAAGRELRRDYGNGVTVDFSYTVGTAEWTGIRGPTFGTVSRSFSKTGRLTSWTLPNGDTFHQAFDGAGRLASETDALGIQTIYQYDGAGNLEKTIREVDGATTTYARDAAGNQLAVTNVGGYTSTTAWTAGRLVSRTDARGFASHFAETPTQNAITDALGRTTTQHLTPLGLPVSVSLPGGTETASSFDGTSLVDNADQFPIAEVDEGGRERAMGYTQASLVTATVPGATATWSFGYTDAVQPDIQFSAQSGDVWLSGPSTEGTPTQLGATDSSLESSGFDSRDWPKRLSSMQSPEGDTTSWVYNDQGLVSTITYPDSGVESLAYNGQGLPSVRNLPDGTELTYTYDAAGNERTRVASTGETRTFVYGPTNRIESASNHHGTVTRTFDNLGRLARVAGAQGGSVVYEHDALGRTTSVTVEVGTSLQTTTYEYDATGNITAVFDPLGGTTTFAYDAVGRLVSKTLPNGITSTFAYDIRDRVLAVEHRHQNGTVLASRTYERAIGGEPTRIVDETGHYVFLGYDESLRIISEEYYDQSNVLERELHYTYDQDGNRLSRDSAGISENYVYSPGAKLETIEVAGIPSDTFAYDANGRTTAIQRDGQTLELGFTVDNQITTIHDGASNLVAEYTFDAMGGRDTVTVGTSTRTFLVAPALGTGYLSNHAVTDETNALVMTYVYAGEHPLMRIDATGAVTYYLQDPQGTTIALADAAGDLSARFAYDSFGNLRSATGAQATLPAEPLGDFRFQGMWLDDTGLYFVRARSYDPQTGRFLSRDPAAGNTAAPETTLPYAFVAGNPWIARDPAGEASIAETAVTLYTSGLFSALPIVATGAYIQAVPTLTRLAPLAEAFTRFLRLTRLTTGEGGTVSVYHGSINHATLIRQAGLSSDRGTVFVTRHLAAAMNAIGPGRYEVAQGIARDIGIIESRIPTAEYIRVLKNLERAYSGFFGANLNSSEIVLRTREAIELFNRHIVK